MHEGRLRVESILADDGKQICEGLFWGDNAENDSNLIAAAPELLSALLDTVSEFESLMRTRKPYTGGNNIALRAHAAIAKATGKATE